MMRRTPLRRTKPMHPGRRSWPMDWRDREDRSEEFASWTPPPRRQAVMAADLDARAPATIDKARPLDCEPYRRYVAALPCWLCHVEGVSQCAHSDEGKGMATKSDDRGCFPACGPHYERGHAVPGCHWLIGTSGRYSREERRAIEQQAAADTQQRLIDWAATDTVLALLLARIGLLQVAA